MGQFELTHLMAKVFSKLSVDKKLIREIMATQSKKEISHIISVVAASPKQPSKKAVKKSKAKAKYEKFAIPRWACKTPLFKKSHNDMDHSLINRNKTIKLLKI